MAVAATLKRHPALRLDSAPASQFCLRRSLWQLLGPELSAPRRSDSCRASRPLLLIYCWFSSTSAGELTHCAPWSGQGEASSPSPWRDEQTRPSQTCVTPCSSSHQTTPHHQTGSRTRFFDTSPWCPPALGLDELTQREEIAFAIFKPGSFVWPYRRDTVDGRERGHIVLFKDDPAGFERGDFGLDILHQPDRLGVGPAGLTLREEYRESAVSATAVEKTSW